MDLSFNLPVLLVDVAAVLLVRGATNRGRAGLALLSAAAVTAVAIVLLHQDPFHLLRLLSFAVFLHGPLVLLGLAWVTRLERPALSRASVSAAVLLGAVALYSFVLEPRWIEVTELRLESPKLTRPVRIAVVSDLQTDRIGSYERRVLQAVMDGEPDLILMTGDYVQERDPARRARLSDELRSLLEEIAWSAPLGVLAVRGNVDDASWRGLFDGLPVTVLPVSMTLEVDELSVTGLDLDDSFDTRFRIAAPGGFHIVFGHAPDFALGEIGADLLVAGHTHGGQVRFPGFGPPITFSRVPRDWAAGATDLPGGRTLVVSRGIGLERGLAPRMRFLCRPELVWIELRPAGPGQDSGRSGAE